MVPYYLFQADVDISPAVVVVGPRIAVVAQHVHPNVSWIPLKLWGRPSPNEVIYIVVVGKALVHDVIQLDCFHRSFRPPPEPFSSRFMKGPPDYGDFLVLQSFQLDRNRIYISYRSRILGSPFSHSFLHVEICQISIESASPQITTCRGEPVPMKTNNSLSICLLVPIYGVCNCAVVSRLPVVPRVVRGVVLHIEGLYERVAFDLLNQIVIVEGSLARENKLTMEAYEILIVSGLDLELIRLSKHMDQRTSRRRRLMTKILDCLIFTRLNICLIYLIELTSHESDVNSNTYVVRVKIAQPSCNSLVVELSVAIAQARVRFSVAAFFVILLNQYPIGL